MLTGICTVVLIVGLANGWAGSSVRASPADPGVPRGASTRPGGRRGVPLGYGPRSASDNLSLAIATAGANFPILTDPPPEEAESDKEAEDPSLPTRGGELHGFAMAITPRTALRILPVHNHQATARYNTADTTCKLAYSYTKYADTT